MSLAGYGLAGKQAPRAVRHSLTMARMARMLVSFRLTLFLSRSSIARELHIELGCRKREFALVFDPPAKLSVAKFGLSDKKGASDVDGVGCALHRECC